MHLYTAASIFISQMNIGGLFLPMNIEHVTMCGIEISLKQTYCTHTHIPSLTKTYPCAHTHTHTHTLSYPSSILDCHTLIIIETSVHVFGERLTLFTTFAAIMHDKHIWISESMREHTRFKLLSRIRGCTLNLCTSCECFYEWVCVGGGVSIRMNRNLLS